MDEQKNEQIEPIESPEETVEQTPAKPNMRTRYLVRILVGGYVAYLGWQLVQSYIQGTASSKALAIIAGAAFLLLCGALAIWSVILLTRDDS